MALHELSGECVTKGVQWKCICGTEFARRYCRKKIRESARFKTWISYLSTEKVSAASLYSCKTIKDYFHFKHRPAVPGYQSGFHSVGPPKCRLANNSRSERNVTQCLHMLMAFGCQNSLVLCL